MSLEAVQDYAVARTIALPPRAKELHRQLRSELIRASDTGSLRTSPAEIHRHVRLLPEPPQQITDQLREHGLHGEAFCIVGGEKNQSRDRDIAHLKRSDDAWFDFSIVVRQGGAQLELLAYDFEIRFPPGMGSPFLRFDLNLPAHRNEAREMRCHLHPGSDDIQVPAPLMSPSELLALFINGACFPADRTKRRTPTPFEVSWFQETYALIRR